MKYYKNSDYALNKASTDIVYNNVNGETEAVTLKKALEENPGMTAEDFQYFKTLSDEDYRETANNDYAAHNQTFFEKLERSDNLRHTPSAEDELMDTINAQEEAKRRQKLFKTVDRLLKANLSEKQYKRYWLHHVGGLTTREIARLDGIKQSNAAKSIKQAEKIINVIFSNWPK